MRRSLGFTLIELLVVIAVIAVLMGIMMPALNKARDLARGVSCKANLKNYTLGMAMYLNDNDYKFCLPEMCYFSTLAPYPPESRLSDHLHLRWCNGEIELKSHPEYGGMMHDYLVDAKAFICPAFRSLAVRHSQDQFYEQYSQSITDYEPWYNYTMNAYLGSENSGIQKSVVKKATDVKHPATTFSFTEESSFVDKAYNESGLNDTFMIPGDDNMIAQWMNATHHALREIQPGPDGVGTFYDVIAGFHNAPSGDRYGGRGNCAFLDGHVSGHPRSETFFLAWPK